MAKRLSREGWHSRLTSARFPCTLLHRYGLVARPPLSISALEPSISFSSWASHPLAVAPNQQTACARACVRCPASTTRHHVVLSPACGPRLVARGRPSSSPFRRGRTSACRVSYTTKASTAAHVLLLASRPQSTPMTVPRPAGPRSLPVRAIPPPLWDPGAEACPPCGPGCRCFGCSSRAVPFARHRPGKRVLWLAPARAGAASPSTTRPRRIPGAHQTPWPPPANADATAASATFSGCCSAKPPLPPLISLIAVQTTYVRSPGASVQCLLPPLTPTASGLGISCEA